MTDIIGCHPNLQWNRIQFQGNDSLGGTQRYSTSMMRKGHLVLQTARHGYRVSIPAFKFTLYTMETHLLQLHDTVCGLETLFMSHVQLKRKTFVWNPEAFQKHCTPQKSGNPNPSYWHLTYPPVFFFTLAHLVLLIPKITPAWPRWNRWNRCYCRGQSWRTFLRSLLVGLRSTW